MICYSCHGELTFPGTISRTAECPTCDADVHCCLNCHNYDPSAHNRCREPQSDWVSDREKANFCDFFIANQLSSSGITRPGEDARRSFENLFKK
jgi:hypothetical protein